MIDQRDAADMIEPSEAAEPIEKAEAAEPIEPIERIEPTEPIERIEPSLAIERIELRERIDSIGEVCNLPVELTLVESRLVGGECSYYACMPTKTMLRATELSSCGRIALAPAPHPPIP